MSSRSPSLRRTLVLALVAVAALSAIASGCLIILTSLLHQTSRSLAETLSGIRVAEKLESDLLLLDRSDGLSATALAGALQGRMYEMGAYVSTGEESTAFHQAQDSLARYLEARAPGARADADRARLMGRAFADLGRLIDINVMQAREAEDKAALWDRRADIIGGTALVLVVVLVTVLVRHLRTQAFRPVFVLADAIDRFTQGDDSVRASETGPVELREIAVRFNAMADALARQRVDRLTFLSGVAHDLRSPLHVLRLGVEVVETEPDGTRRSEMLQRVRRQVGRLERMTTDFIDAAQVESGRVTLDRRSVDAGGIATRSVESFVGATPNHRIERFPPRALPIVGDPHRLEQVLVNLIGNAIKYSPEGGCVRVSVDHADGAVVFAVADDGVGMTPEEAAVVFEPFRRAGRLQAEIPGAGLGLSIVRRLVEAHGGAVTVASEPGRGSTFTVSIPTAAPPRGGGETSDVAETAGVGAPGPVRRG